MALLAEPVVILFALCVASTSWRYDGSDAFRRPLQLSVITLVLAAVGFLAWALFRRKRGDVRYEPLSHLDDDKAATDSGAKSPGKFVQIVLVAATTLRVILFWRITKGIHCSWSWVQAFLPLSVGICDAIISRSAHLTPSTTRGAHAIFLVVALLWGFAIAQLFLSTERPTGVICPAEALDRLAPLGQFVLLVVDSAIITYIGSLTRGRGPHSTTLFKLGGVCLVAAGVTLGLAFGDLIVTDIRWDFRQHYVPTRDLFFDSIAAAITLLAGVKALASLTPTVLATLATCAGTFAYVETRVLDQTLAAAWTTWPGRIATLLVFVGAGAAGHFSSPIQKGPTAGQHRNFRPWILSAVLLVVVSVHVLVFPKPGPRGVSAIRFVIDKARDDSQRWLAGAKVSTNLGEAVDEYKKRYGIPPPPGFDKWYEYAVQNESPIIDDFAQIHEAFMPFWGIEPKVIRERTIHLMETEIAVAGVAVQNGTVKPMVDHWLTNHVAEMIEPFAQWLPDMQLAFNLDDECRVSVPYERMQEHHREGEAARKRLAAQASTGLHGFSRPSEDKWRAVRPNQGWSQYFERWYQQPILYEWIATTCPPDSYARNHHWWSTKSSCVGCYDPHTIDGVISNWTLAGDLCHQPDLLYLHGTLLAPFASRPTHELFPVFSQSRFHNFADILYPNPWNFASQIQHSAEHAIRWEEKRNTLFWRGAHTEGGSTRGQWRQKLRTRFVDMTMRARGELRSANIDTDATFVGEFGNCGEGDCEVMRQHFYGPKDTPAPAPIPFDEAWKNRHLMDMDGAAFSGRFPAFVQSNSLPYRAAIWRAWWEDRVHSFVHFVPVDVRLVRDLWRLVEYFGNAGMEDGKKIADEGAKWAAKSLRREDMRIYLFRQLLEWGRVVDDKREEIGFKLN